MTLGTCGEEHTMLCFQFCQLYGVQPSQLHRRISYQQTAATDRQKTFSARSFVASRGDPIQFYRGLPLKRLGSHDLALIFYCTGCRRMRFETASL
jgi:hypothetical protein